MGSRLDDPLLVLLDYRLPLGVIALDQDVRVISRNYAAQAILDERDGLMLVRGRLVADHPEEALTLEGLLAGACINEGGLESAGGVVHVSRRAPRRFVSVFVAPLRWPSVHDFLTMPAALVLMSDPEREALHLESLLEHRCGLTRSEIEVTLLLLGGARAEEVARQRRTSVNTARTHIKRILGKVGVQSQVELVRVLLAGPRVPLPIEATPSPAPPPAFLPRAIPVEIRTRARLSR